MKRTLSLNSKNGTSTRSLRRPALIGALLLLVGMAMYSVSPATQILDVANLKVARVGHTATELADGKVLIIGGQNADGAIKDSEVFDPASRTFSLGAQSLDGRTEHTATLLADGRVLVIGGRANDQRPDSTEIYDPASDAFSRGPKLNIARAGHTATLFGNGRLLIAGGDDE